jgi:hypothetical protein
MKNGKERIVSLVRDVGRFYKGVWSWGERGRVGMIETSQVLIGS